MNGKCFVDTNILVYAHDHSAGAKCNKALLLTQKLWDSGNGVLSTQVLQELYIALRRKVSSPLSAFETEQVLRDYFAWEIVVNTRESVIRAISMETRYKISFWDGLILQAAERASATVLYSEDLSHGQIYGTVRVVNPFVAA
jgi:predicted nucleic acid-binding protein